MSNPKTEAPRRRISLDDLTKLLAVAVAVVSVGKYFYDKAEAAAHEAQARSISYIEAYGTDPVLGAREALYSFWAAQPELVQLFGNQSLSERQYKTMLFTTLFRNDLDVEIRSPLLHMDNFYSQMSFCAKSGLCDREILDAYFCTVTRKNVLAYGPFYARIREATGDSGIGLEMTAFAQGCPTPLSVDP